MDKAHQGLMQTEIMDSCSRPEEGYTMFNYPIMVDLYLQCPEKERHIMNATCITIKSLFYYLKSLHE